MGMIEIRRRIIFGDSSHGEIPNEYQEVEYIESGNEDAYIITDYLSSGIVTAKWKMSFIDSIPKGENCVFGWLGDGTEYGLYADFYGNKFYGAVLNSRYRGGITVSSNVMYDCSMSALSLNMGNYSQSPEYTGLINTPSGLGIFCANKDGNPFWIASRMRLYYLQIYNGKTLSANFVPCYRIADGEIGVYDTVSKRFYANDGTGLFQKGVDV